MKHGPDKSDNKNNSWTEVKLMFLFTDTLSRAQTCKCTRMAQLRKRACRAKRLGFGSSNVSVECGPCVVVHEILVTLVASGIECAHLHIQVYPQGL